MHHSEKTTPAEKHGGAALRFGGDLLKAQNIYLEQTTSVLAENPQDSIRKLEMKRNDPACPSKSTTTAGED